MVSGWGMSSHVSNRTPKNNEIKVVANVTDIAHASDGYDIIPANTSESHMPSGPLPCVLSMQKNHCAEHVCPPKEIA